MQKHRLSEIDKSMPPPALPEARSKRHPKRRYLGSEAPQNMSTTGETTSSQPILYALTREEALDRLTRSELRRDLKQIAHAQPSSNNNAGDSNTAGNGHPKFDGDAPSSPLNPDHEIEFELNSEMGMSWGPPSVHFDTSSAGYSPQGNYQAQKTQRDQMRFFAGEVQQYSQASPEHQQEYNGYAPADYSMFEEEYSPINHHS